MQPSAATLTFAAAAQQRRQLPAPRRLQLDVARLLPAAGGGRGVARYRAAAVRAAVGGARLLVDVAELRPLRSCRRRNHMRMSDFVKSSTGCRMLPAPPVSSQCHLGCGNAGTASLHTDASPAYSKVCPLDETRSTSMLQIRRAAQACCSGKSCRAVVSTAPGCLEPESMRDDERRHLRCM